MAINILLKTFPKKMLKNCYYQIFKQNCYQHMKTKWLFCDFRKISYTNFFYEENDDDVQYHLHFGDAIDTKNMKKFCDYTLPLKIWSLLLSLLIGSKILLIKYNLMFRYTNCKLQIIGKRYSLLVLLAC